MLEIPALKFVVKAPCLEEGGYFIVCLREVIKREEGHSFRYIHTLSPEIDGHSRGDRNALNEAWRASRQNGRVMFRPLKKVIQIVNGISSHRLTCELLEKIFVISPF